MVEGDDYSGQYNDSNIKIRDLEEKQRALKDRLLLVGQNLIDTKEQMSEKMMEMKKDIVILKQSMEKLISFLETASNEFSKFAKKEDVEILAKQAKMFQQLET
jgi:hypothetical protein